MLALLVLLGIILKFSSVLSTDFDSCMNATRPFATRVSGCEKTPCKFQQGTNVIFEMDFGVDHDVNKMEAKVLAYALGVETSYPLPQPDVCLGLINGECPLDAGEELTYRMEMPILTSFPKVHVIIQFYLESEYGIESCCKISANVV